MLLLRPEIFAPHPGVCCALSTRGEGDAPPPYHVNLSFHVGDAGETVAANRNLFFESLSFTAADLAAPRQVHGRTLLRAELPGLYGDCDGLVTDHQRLLLGILFADCVPIFLYDPRRAAVAAVHAGWRGTASGICRAAVEMLQQAFDSDPADLLVHIGPAAGPCCYTVGREVAELFEPGLVRLEGELTYLDLKLANARQLYAAGVLPGHVETSPFCTISETALLHSYRRDGRNSGRMLGVIGLTGQSPPR